ncbi:efflux RND transporter periplasmic adaptor subunit [Maricurvus nonylphenolicus]|uniref:efflux RND transporter periplasmic adaptor subunit n=1 Tax=Maricurvus nonylphenolicus TaxID=1008307 RepID=UPI0036F2D2CB
MNNLQKLLLPALLLASAALPVHVYALSDHNSDHDGDHHDEHQHDKEHSEAEGPNGGKLLTDDDFAIEVTIFENGTPPEMRLFAYHQGEQIDPKEVNVQVTLNRLDGSKDLLSFRPENNFLVSEQVVTEPHSFDVSVSSTFDHHHSEAEYESHEGRTTISDRQIALSGIETESAQSQTLTFSDTLFGVIGIPEDNIYQINAPYPGIVEKVHVNTGDQVKRGQTLVTLRNTDTLQRYTISSPTDGEVTERHISNGARALNQALLEITDLSSVWVEMSAFPESIEKLALGQDVIVSDLHQHEQANGKVTYIAPQMTGGHIARARTTITNPDGHWRPGMHVKAHIQTGTKTVPLAVKKQALQNFRDFTVVFAQYDNTFEVRMLELGESDGDYVEVLGGLKPGTEYVTKNSFILKADILKDGASHDH